jgi:hypothetical protein
MQQEIQQRRALRGDPMTFRRYAQALLKTTSTETKN